MRTLWLLFYVLTYSFIQGRHIVDQGGLANQPDFGVEGEYNGVPVPKIPVTIQYQGHLLQTII